MVLLLQNYADHAMSLQRHIIYRILLAGIFCFLLNLAWVVYDSDQQNRSFLQNTASTLFKELQLQLIQAHAGYMPLQQFPDFSLWKQTSQAKGICVIYAPDDVARVQQICAGHEDAEAGPEFMAQLYQHWFSSNYSLHYPLAYNHKKYGTLTVSLDVTAAFKYAWNTTLNLLTLTASILIGVSLIVYYLLNRLLQPAQQIISGIHQLTQSELNYRLPISSISIWADTAVAINQLAAAQQQLINERQALLAKLLQTQEQEQQYLARELHDEFGQYLTALQAIALALPAESEREMISETLGEMQMSLQNLLNRLRPLELDELGLNASLRRLVSIWRRSCQQTQYHLQILGDDNCLSAMQSIAIYRIVQEALNNIARHASATQAEIFINISQQHIGVDISDNGVASNLAHIEPGMGIIGMRERANTLQGEFCLSIIQPHGLNVHVEMPVSDSAHA